MFTVDAQRFVRGDFTEDCCCQQFAPTKALSLVLGTECRIAAKLSRFGSSSRNQTQFQFQLLLIGTKINYTNWPNQASTQHYKLHGKAPVPMNEKHSNISCLDMGFFNFFHTCGKPNPFLQFCDVAEVVIIRKNV
jgi:hypothetical protein